jgi:hypothetical protein
MRRLLAMLQAINKKPKARELALLFLLFIVSPVYLTLRAADIPVLPAEGPRIEVAPTQAPAEPGAGPAVRQDPAPDESDDFVPPQPRSFAYMGTRNIFVYPTRRPVAPPRPVVTPTPAAAATPDEAAAALAAVKPTAVPIQLGFKFIGVLGSGENRVAILKKDDGIYVAREGELLSVQGQDKQVTDYWVLKIGLETVEMGYRDLGRGTQKIKLEN